MSDTLGIIKRVLRAFWNGVTRVRLALSNLLFLLVLVLIFVLFSGRTPPPLPDRAALLLNPVGTVVEQKSYVEPFTLLLSRPLPQEREVLLSDLVDAILNAKDDPAITALVMELDQLYSIGVSKTGEIAEALEEFRSTGKPIVAWGDSFSQVQYLLAAQADTLIIHGVENGIHEVTQQYLPCAGAACGRVGPARLNVAILCDGKPPTHLYQPGGIGRLAVIGILCPATSSDCLGPSGAPPADFCAGHDC